MVGFFNRLPWPWPQSENTSSTFFYFKGEAMATAKELLDRLAIREIVENWALLRDARRWERFRVLWHEEGRMITTWIEGSFEEFAKACQAGYDKGVRFLHFLAARPSTSSAIAPSLRRSK